jgi:VanZ family protein
MSYVRLLFHLCLLAILIFSLLPGEEILGVIPLGGALMHFGAFLFLGMLIDTSYPERKVIAKVLFLVLYGAFIEAVQYFVPFRFCSPVDLAIDSIGVCLYFAVLRRPFHRFVLPAVRRTGFPC